MENKQVAGVLYEIAQLLELHEENIFKIRAYQNAARSLEGLKENVTDLVTAGRLQEVPGIGKAIAEKISELIRTGKIDYYEKLKANYPATLFELMRVPNLGPKKIRKLYDDLGITNLKDLEFACLDNRISEMRGFGKKTQERILEGIKTAATAQGHHLISRALPVAQEILEYMRGCKSLDRIEIAGSVRRWKEVISDLDFVASSSNPVAVHKYFLTLPFIHSVIARGDSKTSVRLDTIGLNVDLRVVKKDEFACAWHHFTGSKEHNVAMRSYAKKLGYKINEYGIFREGTNRPISIKTEKDLFAFFKMDYIPPELREGLGEVNAALEHKIPAIVEPSEIRGVFHVHSVWSDGRNSLEDMVVAARDRGYEYVGISEHSKVATYARGLDEKRLKRSHEEIDDLRRKYKNIQILKGIEVDILPDGSLDFPDEILSRLDFVIASVHSQFRMEEKEMTARVCRALSNPHVDILGHATGRLLLGRKGYAINLDEVFKTAAWYKKIIEINANPHRLDLDWTHVKKAREMGIRFAVNPDAHSIKEYDHMKFGIGVARKGWTTAEDIINTRPVDQLAF